MTCQISLLSGLYILLLFYFLFVGDHYLRMCMTDLYHIFMIESDLSLLIARQTLLWQQG